MAFWESKTLLSAVELGVFTALADGPQDGVSLAKELATDAFLDQRKPSYVGGLLEMLNTRKAACPSSSPWPIPTFAAVGSTCLQCVRSRDIRDPLWLR
jgi:hypothetical protein